MQVISWNHTIITYEEAISLGLLGEKKGECLSEDKEVWTPYMDYLERKESPSEDIVNKIMEEIDKYWWVEVYTREWFENLLKKHLSSK